MPAPIAKIHQPTISEVLPRNRLFDQLDQAARRPVVWVSAPAGCGKTTLVASWLDARKLPSLWYQVDEGDDGATFFYYMGLAAKKAASRNRKPLPLFTPEYLHGVSVFAKRYFEQLYSRFKPPLTIVFDDYQEAPVDSQFHEVIRSGLSVTPPGITVVIISRSTPPETLARLKADRRMAVLGWEDIKLTLEETAAIAALQGQDGIPAETVRHMHEITQGWTAGVILLTDGTPSAGIRALPEKTDPRDIFAYFAGEILAKADRETVDFLLKTSFLPQMTVGMAKTLTGLEHAEQVFSHLLRNHYFVQKHGHSDAVYQYHPMFRDFLRSHVGGNYTEEEISSLRRSAAALLEKNGQCEDAAILYREAADWDGLARLASEHAPALLGLGRNRTLLEWLDSVPAELMDNSPWLIYWRAAGWSAYDLRRSRTCFEQAFELFKDREEPVGAYLSWVGVVNTYIYEWGSFTALDRWIVELEQLLQRHPAFPTAEIEAHVVAGMFSALMFRQPHHPDFGKWERRVGKLMQESSDINYRMTVGNQLIIYYTWWVGDFIKAEAIINFLHAAAQKPGVTPLTLITWHSMRAAFYWFTGAHQECLQAVGEGLRSAENHGIHLLDFRLLSQAAYSHLTAGNYRDSAEYRAKMVSVMNSACYLDVAHYNYLSYVEAMYRNNYDRAVEYAAEALKLVSEAGVPLSQGVCHSALAHALIERGEHDRAVPHLGAARDIARAMGSKHVEYVCLICEARSALERGMAGKGLDYLRQALEMGRRQGFFNMALFNSSFLSYICITALEADIETEFVQELIRRCKIKPDVPPVHIESWPWPLKIYTMGCFTLVKDGQAVKFSGKVQQKPLAMLKALIALGGREVSEEVLSDHLWAEADGATAHTAFNTTLYRLRQLLGNERAILMSDGKITLNPHYCWVDAWAFERICGQVESLLKEKASARNPAELVQLADKGLALYQGSFLAGDAAQPWAISRRERLRSRFLHVIGSLGLFWEGAGKWRKAVECYRKGLETDDLAEDFYQRLMVCHQQLGSRAEALTVYNRCRSTLAAVLGVSPSAKTMAIYKAITDRL